MRLFLFLSIIFAFFTEAITCAADAAIKKEHIKPCYTLTMLSADPYQSDTESDGESDEEFVDQLFEQASQHATQNNWDKLPFSIAPTALQEIRPAAIEEAKTDLHGHPRITALATRIEQEGFACSKALSLKEANTRLRQVILANRLKSISRKRNYQNKEVTALQSTTDVNEQEDNKTILAYHLIPTWYEIQESSGHKIPIITTLDKVQRFFRAWKQWEAKQKIDKNSDKSMAHKFRLHYEKDLFRAHVRTIVPFHTLRETLKSHPCTATYVQKFATQEPNADQYLVFFDDDFGPLTAGEQSLFANYDALVQQQKDVGNPAPSIMTTGYRFMPGSTNALAHVGNEIDRAVRIATASIIPNGVCYPEPNILIHIPIPIKRQLFRAMFNTKSDGKSQTETRQFIKALYATGEAAPQTTVFAEGLPIYTAPSKEILEQSKIVKHGWNDNKLTEWNQDTIKYLRTFSQSHLEPRDLTWGLVTASPLSKQFSPQAFGFDPLTIKSFAGTTGQTRFNIAISAVSRMVTAYNPINAYILDHYKTCDASSFRQVLYQLLTNYDAHFPQLFPVKETTKSKSLYGQYLYKVQTTNSLKELRQILKDMFGLQVAQNIEEAARKSGKAITKGILNYFDFGDMQPIVVTTAQ